MTEERTNGLAGDLDRFWFLKHNIEVLIAERNGCERRRPEEFERWSNFDPRGFAESGYAAPADRAAVKRFEAWFVEQGLGDICDLLSARDDELEPIVQRLAVAEPQSLADRALVAQVLAKELGLYVDDDEPTWGGTLHARLLLLLGAIARQAPAQGTAPG